MINYSTLQGLAIPEGVVTQIADESGRILWNAVTTEPVVLEVEKIISNTYVGETLYEDEQFILLDIYPKTNGTVKVTYGGLTKTITDTSGAEEPNAQQVFFGIFNGASDNIVTPVNGTLTIEGDYVTFGVGSYTSSSTAKMNGSSCGCITSITEWGSTSKLAVAAFKNCSKLKNIVLPDTIKIIESSAFYGCSSLALTSLPGSITAIGNSAFYICTNLSLNKLPESVASIGDNAFNGCSGLTLTSLPNNLVTIGIRAFENCTSLALTEIPNGVTSIGNYAFRGCSNIKNIVIPASVTSIGFGSLYCYEIKELLTGNTYIEFNATNVRMLGTNPPTMTTLPDSTTIDAFGSQLRALKGTITVPKGCGEIYKNAPVWTKRKEYIVEES